MRRHLLGIISIVMLALGIAMFWWNPLDNEFWHAAFLRVGVVLFALWLALPQLMGLKRWLFNAVMIVAVVAAAFSKLAWILVPAIIAIWIFSPKSGKDSAAAADSGTK